MPPFLAPARTKDSGRVPPGRACGGMGYWAVLCLGSSCCCLRKLNKTTGWMGVRERSWRWMQGLTWPPPGLSSCRYIPGSPTQKERLGWRENLHAASLLVFREASQVALVVKNLPANIGGIRAMSSIAGSGKSPGGGQQPTPVFLPGEFHGQRRLTVYSS